MELVSSQHLKSDNVNHSSVNGALISMAVKANSLGKRRNRSRERNSPEHKLCSVLKYQIKVEILFSLRISSVFMAESSRPSLRSLL